MRERLEELLEDVRDEKTRAKLSGCCLLLFALHMLEQDIVLVLESEVC